MQNVNFWKNRPSCFYNIYRI